jgi:peptidoglycan/LPS O-acetylase OafA/YrhL
MKRALGFLAYVALLTLGLYIFELHHDWRPNKAMIPTGRAFFLGLELCSAAFLIFARRWWLPGASLFTAFAGAPLLSGAGFTLGYSVWSSILIACALGLGAAIRMPKEGS